MEILKFLFKLKYFRKICYNLLIKLEYNIFASNALRALTDWNYIQGCKDIPVETYRLKRSDGRTQKEAEDLAIILFKNQILALFKYSKIKIILDAK